MLLLASASPRRKAILEQIGMACKVVPSDCDESLDGLEPLLAPRILAERKAMQVSLQHPLELCVGFDTLVFLNKEPLGKPMSVAQARSMLLVLRGATHQVITGYALVKNGALLDSGAECTQVTFRNFTESELDDYIATGEPMDKAGSYGIQGQGARLVSSIEGCYYNVVGLPISAFLESLARIPESFHHVR